MACRRRLCRLKATNDVMANTGYRPRAVRYYIRRAVCSMMLPIAASDRTQTWQAPTGGAREIAPCHNPSAISAHFNMRSLLRNASTAGSKDAGAPGPTRAVAATMSQR